MSFHTVPIIRDPLGKHWDQPKIKDVTLDGDNARMSKESFDKLSEYSMSQPSGVYIGKMWKRNRYWHPSHGKPAEWYLCWYDESEKGPDWCNTKTRRIVVQ